MPEGVLPPLILELRARAGQVRSELGTVRRDVNKLDQDTAGGLSRTQKAAHGMASVGKTALLGLAGGAAVAGGAALKLGIDYQESTTKLVTGAGESEKSIGMVRDGMLSMAGSVGTMPQDLSKGMYLIESAGFHAADGLKVLHAAAEGAKIGGADMTSVADGLTTALSDYHIPASNAATVTSQLVATVAAGKTTMGALAGSLHNVLPAAAAAHLGLGQVLGAMSTMTGQGISADQASQDLGSTLRALQSPSQQQAKAMEELGLNSVSVARNLGKNGLTGTLTTLTTAIAKHTKGGLIFVSTLKESQAAAADAKSEFAALPASLQPLAKQFMEGSISSKDWRKSMSGMTVEQKQLAQQFAATVNKSRGFSDLVRSGTPAARTFASTLSTLTGGATGMNTALALTGGNASTFLANVKGISGATAEAGGHVKGWSETSKDLATQIAQAKATVVALATKIGMALIPYVEKAIKVVQGIVNWFGKHTTVAKVLAGVIGGVLAAAIAVYVGGLVKAAAESVVNFAKMVSSSATWVAEQVAGFASAVASAAAWTAEHAVMAATTIAGWVATAAAATAAFIAENAAMLGIGVAIAALIAAVVWLVTHWRTAWNAIKEAVAVVWRDVLHPVFNAIGTAAEWIWRQITVAGNGIGRAWSAVWGGVRAVYDDVVAPVWRFISDGITSVWHIIESVAGTISRVWNELWTGLRTTVTNVVSDIGSIVSGIWDGITSGLRAIVNGGIDIVNAVIGGINTLIDGANELPFVNIPHVSKIPHFEKGGVVGDGYFIAGEKGPEIGYKSGGHVRLSPHGTVPRGLVAAIGGGKLAPGGGAGSKLGPVGGGGGHEVIEVHSHVYLDGKQISESVEKHSTRKGMRRGTSYQNYQR